MVTRRLRARQSGRSRQAGWPAVLEVRGLFREGLSRSIELRLADRVTILSGPNGSGKTRLLMILRSALAFDWSALAAEPFDRMLLAYSTGRTLTVTRSKNNGEVILGVLVQDKSGVATRPVEIALTYGSTANLVLPEWIVQVEEHTWEDMRDGELLDLDDLNMRFPARSHGDLQSGPWQLSRSQADELQEVREAIGRLAPPTLIETKRLDVRSRRQARRVPQRLDSRQERIHDYVNQIQAQVQAARAEYSRIAQLADSQFASRALEKSVESPPALPDLRKQFMDLAKLHRELLTTGLVAETPGVEMRSGSLTKAERRILAVFLSDWHRKLAPLLPVHEKLQMLQQIVGEKLKDKHLRLDENARLRIETVEGTVIPVDQLSSGEQHLLALFAMLLFSASQSSVVLIDEPEISLHAEWKHAFLDDIQRVASTADLQFVLATHSTAIINGQWDLVEEL